MIKYLQAVITDRHGFLQEDEYSRLEPPPPPPRWRLLAVLLSAAKPHLRHSEETEEEITRGYAG